MGAIRDSIVMDSGPIELRMDICEGEHRNHDGNGPLMTRLDFAECHPRTSRKGVQKGLVYKEKREWFATVAEARARQRATIPAMLARYLKLIVKYGDYSPED